MNYKIYKSQKMVNLIFGASGSMGSSVTKIIEKKYKNKNFLFVSRTKPNCRKSKWINCDLNKNISKLKYKNVECCIFLASPYYIKKNMSIKIFNKEYLWIKKIINNIKIKKLVYVSSPTIYFQNHYIGVNKRKIEKFLLKNKKKFKSLQIWRPYNLVNTNLKKYSDHFHSLLFKIMFIQKKSQYTFNGNKDDTRGYTDIDNFSNILIKNSFSQSSFIKDFGNLNVIKIDKIIEIYNKYFYLKFKKVFIPKFKSINKNKNIIKKNPKNSIYSNQSSVYVIKKYLLNNLYG